MARRYSGPQRRGTEFGGASQQNTTQPHERFSDLSASDQARLIKTTGQNANPAAKADSRHWNGQSGKKPRYDT